MAPNKEITNAAPLNILSSTKIPKLIGPPIFTNSIALFVSGEIN